MLTRSHVSSGFPAMVTAEAAALFGNVRVPAALVAGASLPLGFAFALPSSEDKLGVRALKGLNLALGFLAVQSELLSVVVATNAINRLTAGGMACVTEGSVTTVMELFRNDPTLLQHWLGTYIHFVGGVFCIVLMCGIRGWLAIGPTLGMPLLTLTAAILARFIAAVNRGIIAQEYGHGNCLLLLWRFVRTFVTNTFGLHRWFDLLSLGLLAASATLFVRRLGTVVAEMADGNGDGDVSNAEKAAFLRKLKDESSV